MTSTCLSQEQQVQILISYLRRDNIKQKWGVLACKYPLNSQKWPSRMDPMTSTNQFQGWNTFFMADEPINDISICLQANNCQLLHMQHHGKVTSFPSWILPMLSWFYVQDRYLSCPKTILGSSFIHMKPPRIEEKDRQTQLLCYVSLIRACNKVL